MTRTLYRSLLWLHPPGFRRQFAGEMLWIFDEAQSPLGLLLDGIASLVRQWMVRCGAWKILAGMLGALVQLLPLAYLSHTRYRPALPLPRTLDYYDLEFPRALALLIILLVCGTGFRACVGFSRRRRS